MPILSIVVAAAVGAQSPAPDYGAPISYADGVRIGEGYIRSDLRDPDSAEFKWPNNFVPFSEQLILSKRVSGYATCFSYNAKNGYGGYAGYETYRIIIHDGKVADLRRLSELRFVPDICKELTVKFGMAPIPVRATP